MFEKKALVVMTIKTSKGYQEVKRFKIPLNKQVFDYDKKTYMVKPEKALLSKGNELIFFYDVNLSEPLTFHTLPLVKSNHLKQVLDNDNLEQLNAKNITKTYYIIMGVLVLGIILTGAWGIWNMSEANKNILELTLKIANMTRTDGVIVVP